MGVPRLILIDGMIGAGKSTLAVQLEGWLAGRGEDARAYNEFAEDHPIRTVAVDRLREHFGLPAVPPDGRQNPGIYGPGQWRRLAERCVEQGQTVILESTFLQNSVLPAFVQDVPRSELEEIFTAIADAAAPAGPALIYLRPTGIRAGLDRTYRDRGPDWAAQNIAYVAARPWARNRGLSGPHVAADLYEAWEQVVDDLLGRFAFSQLLVSDPQDDRDGAFRRICACIRPDGPEGS
jgi:hypothetical protein